MTGRFAPSPTGALHFGSLVAAVASYLSARSQDGQWLVRMEDVDRPRCVPGAAADILRTLEAFGFTWDGPSFYQSTRDEAYAEALAALGAHAYACGCSRKDVCHCRTQAPAVPRAWRFRAQATTVSWLDRCQGPQQWPLDDFVLKRADGLYAYQLAVVVDDAAQGVTEVVRGADLLDSTPRQIALQQALGLPTPSYLHLPVVRNAQGEKLSKQTLAPPLQTGLATQQLAQALIFLGQPPPAPMPLPETWQWALAHWDERRVPACPL